MNNDNESASVATAQNSGHNFAQCMDSPSESKRKSLIKLGRGKQGLIVNRECNCRSVDKVVIRVETQDLVSEVVICRRHGVIRQRMGGAARSIPDCLRRWLPRNRFLQLARQFNSQAESVLLGELLTLENEIQTTNKLSLVAERAREILRQCGDAT